MADRIKGITIEIDGQTTGLKKALGDITSQSISVQKELNDVNRLLKFDPGNTEALAQKQELLSKQIEITSQKLQRLKDAQSQVEQQFKSGKIGAEQYRAFQREIQFTEGSLNKLKQSLSSVDNGDNIQKVKKDMDDLSKSTEEAEDKTGELRSGLSQLVVGAAAGVGIGKVIEDALDTSSLNTKINVSFNVPEESVQSVKNAIGTVETYGVDSEAALEGVRRQWALNKDASDESNSAVVQGAATIVTAYGDVDFTELIQETNELSKILEISDEDALALTYSLLQMGFPPDQLDIITEYGTQLQMAGFNAQEVQAVMAAGVKTGTWNIDNLLDGLKEGRIKLAEFALGVPDAMVPLIDCTDISIDQFKVWGEAVANGGEGGTEAMVEAAKALNGVQDETIKNLLGVQMFGTMWEDQGANITDTLLGMNDNLMTAEENQNNLNKATEALNADPAIQMKTAISNLMTALTPLLVVIANIIGKLAEFIANNPKIAASITAIVVAISIFMGVITGILPVIETLITAATSAVGVAGGVGGALAALTGPIGIATAAIVGMIAIFAALYENNEGFRDNVNQTWEQIKTTIGTIIENIKVIIAEFVVIAQALWAQYGDQITKIATDVWNNIAIIIQTVMTAIKDWLNVAMALMKGDWTGAWEGIKQGFADVWGGIFELLKGIFILIIDQINLFTGGALTAIGNWITSVIAWFADLPNKASALWETIKTAFSDGWNSIVTFFTESVPAWLESMGTWFAELPNKIAYGLGEAIGSVIKWGTDTYTYLTTNVPIWIESISKWFSELPGKIWTFLADVVTKLGEWGSNVLNYITTNVPIWINNVVTFFSELPGKIGEWLTQVVTDVGTWGSNMLTTATTGMQSVFDGIVNTFTNLPSKMAEIGTNIVAGIKQGISDAWEGMTGWIGGLCDSFTEGIKDALDIHSPSRVMRKLGNFTGEGFGLGIGDTVSSISKQANAIADAAIPNINAGSYDMGVNYSPIGGNNIQSAFAPASKQPVTLQLVLQNGRAIAEYIIDDVDTLMGSKNKFTGRMTGA